MKNLINAIKTKHVNFEVLTAAILHLSEEEQVKVDKRITEVIGLPVHATASSIACERQKRVDGLDEYDVILDAFAMLKKVTAELDDMRPEGVSNETLSEAQMFIGTIEDD